MNAKQKILLLTYAKFGYMQNLRICKSLPCVQGFRTASVILRSAKIYILRKQTTQVLSMHSYRILRHSVNLKSETAEIHFESANSINKRKLQTAYEPTIIPSQILKFRRCRRSGCIAGSKSTCILCKRAL